MLEHIIKKFPEVFKNHPHFMTQVDAQRRTLLENIFVILEKVDLVTELYVKSILEVSCDNEYDSLRNMLSLINHLEQSNSLDHSTLQTVIAAKELHATHTLFKHCQLSYTKEDFKLFALFASILNNPLCKTIFDARLRHFAEMSEPKKDPLLQWDKATASDFIKKLNAADSYDQKIEAFYDYFIAFRPLPCSQKYIVEIDLEEQIVSALTFFLQQMINAVNTQEDYNNTFALIKTLKYKGGTREVFDAIKYEIASSIESEDMCSFRTFKDHMLAISTLLQQPQKALKDFTEELRKSKGYQPPSPINTHSTLFPQFPSAVKNNQNELTRRFSV